MFEAFEVSSELGIDQRFNTSMERNALTGINCETAMNVMCKTQISSWCHDEYLKRCEHHGFHTQHIVRDIGYGIAIISKSPPYLDMLDSEVATQHDYSLNCCPIIAQHVAFGLYHYVQNNSSHTMSGSQHTA